MVIIVDNREQTPWIFPPEQIVKAGTLQTGDYSIEGLTDLICVERKSVQDLVGCIGKGRERFERELHRMRGYRFACVIVEGSLRKLSGGNWRGKITPTQLLGSVASWRIRYNVDFIYADNAELGAQECERILRKYRDYLRSFARRFKDV